MADAGQDCVYILRCADGTLYTGWTNDIARRLAAHNAGRAAKYTRSRRPVTLCYSEAVAGRSAALRRELEIKAMTRIEKEALARTFQDNERGSMMGRIPTIDEARELVRQYNTEAFHLRHAEIVSGVLGWFAKEYDPGNEDYWAVVGMLHDIDFEQWPDEHCVKASELLRTAGIDEEIIRAVQSHGYGCTGADIEPTRPMEKALFAVDELTGLIGAVSAMRPSKSVSDLELKSVMKKYKTPAFAAGCSREIIAQGAEMMGVSLEELIEKTILAMRSLMDRMEI